MFQKSFQQATRSSKNYILKFDPRALFVTVHKVSSDRWSVTSGQRKNRGASLFILYNISRSDTTSNLQPDISGAGLLLFTP